jgi:hypothetical protein
MELINTAKRLLKTKHNLQRKPCCTGGLTEADLNKAQVGISKHGLEILLTCI